MTLPSSMIDFCLTPFSIFFYFTSIRFLYISIRYLLQLFLSLILSSVCAISLPINCRLYTSEYRLYSFTLIYFSYYWLFILASISQHYLVSLIMSLQILRVRQLRAWVDSCRSDFQNYWLRPESSSSKVSMNLLSSTFSECFTFFQLNNLLSQSSCISFLNFMRVSIASIRYEQFRISTVFVRADQLVISRFKISAKFFLFYSYSSTDFSFCLAESSSAISISTSFIAYFSRARCSISSLLYTGLKGSLCGSRTGLRLEDVLSGVGVVGILNSEMLVTFGDSLMDSVFSVKLIEV